MKPKGAWISLGLIVFSAASSAARPDDRAIFSYRTAECACQVEYDTRRISAEEASNLATVLYTRWDEPAEALDVSSEPVVAYDTDKRALEIARPTLQARYDRKLVELQQLKLPTAAEAGRESAVHALRLQEYRALTEIDFLISRDPKTLATPFDGHPVPDDCTRAPELCTAPALAEWRHCITDAFEGEHAQTTLQQDAIMAKLFPNAKCECDDAYWETEREASFEIANQSLAD